MSSEGVRGMPDDTEEESTILPDGSEVPPGLYTITMTLTGTADEIEPIVTEVKTLIDPRSPFSQAEIQENFEALAALQELKFSAVDAVERIIGARDDIGTIQSLIGKRPDASHNDTLITLSDEAKKISTALDELEKLIRVPPETTGIVYDADKLVSHISTAQYYVGSSRGAPSVAAATYIAIAERETSRIITEVDAYLGGELVVFRKSVREAGIGLLSDIEPALDL